LQVSWGWQPTGAPPDERDEFGSTPRLQRLEFEGTRDLCPWLAFPTAIDFQAGLGLGCVRARQRELARHARLRLGALPGLRPATPENPDLSGGMMAFELPAGVDPAALRRELWAERIELNVVERPDRLLLRTSTHLFNTEGEVDRLAEALPGMLRRSRPGA
jgi:isopenicillin-N epimerase